MHGQTEETLHLHLRFLTVHLICFSVSIIPHLCAHCWQQDSIRFLSTHAGMAPTKDYIVNRGTIAKAPGRQRQFCPCVCVCVCVRTIMVSELIV